MELAKYRKRAGLTQAELGRKLGVFNRQTVGAWEANPDNMKHGTMKAYASACGVTVADLMGFDGDAQAFIDQIREAVHKHGHCVATRVGKDRMALMVGMPVEKG